MELNKHTLARLRSQISNAGLVLFTGAGFSCAALDRKGRPLPSVSELKKEIWDLCFATADFDSSTNLGDLFEVAMKRNKAGLETLLNERLTVDTDSLPEFYSIYFDLPWFRCYTLNVDDLEQAAARKFDLTRTPVEVSATLRSENYVNLGDSLEVVHLNGIVTDSIETLTFSERQYAIRVARQEPWYARCVADLISRPTVFIGTELHEVPLWQHMELRKTHGGGGKDLRPTSILIAPSLNSVRQEILHEHRVEWFPGTAEAFSEVLAQFKEERTKGFVSLSALLSDRGRSTVPLVSDLAPQRPNLETDYLLGEEPHWADLLQGRAVSRVHATLSLFQRGCSPSRV